MALAFWMTPWVWEALAWPWAEEMEEGIWIGSTEQLFHVSNSTLFRIFLRDEILFLFVF